MARTDPLVFHLDPSIRDHVAKMIEDADTLHKCHIRVNQTQRSQVQAQTFHVLHMYLYNYFPHLKPRHLAADGSTISWSHLSDPKVQWVLIDDLKIRELLRTESGGPVSLRDDGRGNKSWVAEPDFLASNHAMAEYLERHHVSSMAAPGVDGCGEPCGCGGHASKHVSGKACDLSGLEELGGKILLAEPGKYQSADDAVDHFLNGYGLWRPLAHLKGKAQELWHVEALPVHVPKKAHGHGRVHSHHHTRHGC